MTIKQLMALRRVAAKPDGYLVQPMKTLGGRTASQNRADQYRTMEALQRDGFVGRREGSGGLWFLTAACRTEMDGETPLARAMRADVVSAATLRAIHPLNSTRAALGGSAGPRRAAP